MYLNASKHLLSDTLWRVALIRLVGAFVSACIRFLLRRQSMMPDMADQTIWWVQVCCSVTVLLCSGIVMLRALQALDRQVRLVPEEDRAEMARLQEEFFGKQQIAALPAATTRRLLQLWMVILVGAQAMYDVSSNVYRRFAVSLAEAMVNFQGETGSAYTEIYNLTHGFKYQGMLVALLLGAMVTAIFLDDRQMEGAVGLITLIYMISTIWIGMGTISLLGHSIGVVWSSVIFHVLETIGLITIARYLRLRYRGV